jgi:hypothetical protein
MSPDGKYILSSDRHEKIRVTYFPVTTRIHGFLLGHDVYVSSFAIHDNQYCISCGGDGYLKVWDFQACKEVASLLLESSDDAFRTKSIPTKVVIVNQDETSFSVAVIFDDSKYLEFFKIELSGEIIKVKRFHQREIPSQPLAIAPWKNGRVALLLRSPPDYLVSCDCKEEGSDQQMSLVALTTGGKNIEMPDSILEKDKRGIVAMVKNNETRGPAQQMPWSDARRKDTARTRNKRANKKRKENKRQQSDSPKDDGNNDEDDDQSMEAEAEEGAESKETR